MNSLIANLFNNGTLPTVNVNVTIDNNSLYKMAGVIVVSIIIGTLFYIAVTKHAK